jgi:hypothetical protein
MYSPTLGRFMQTDTIGYADGLNWYNYVDSDPVNFSDPSGLKVLCGVQVGGYPPDCKDDGNGFRPYSGSEFNIYIRDQCATFDCRLPDEVIFDEIPEIAQDSLEYLIESFCSIRPIEVTIGGDAYFILGGSASAGFNFDIRTLQLRGIAQGGRGAGFGAGFGLSIGTGSAESGTATGESFSGSYGGASITIDRDFSSGSAGVVSFGPHLGGWGTEYSKAVSQPTSNLTGGCNVK